MFSPCPNDTFIFHAWVHQLIPGAPKIEVSYADIDITNNIVLDENAPDILKISYAALPWVLDEYKLLSCGGALGRGCGPLVLTKESIGEIDPTQLSGKKVAVPSDKSTAWIRASIDYAWSHPEASKDYIMKHAQELSLEVAQAHINLYVNEYSSDLGESGFAAAEALLSRAAQEGLVPKFDLALLR